MKSLLLCLAPALACGCSVLASMDNYSFDRDSDSHTSTDSGAGSASTPETESPPDTDRGSESETGQATESPTGHDTASGSDTGHDTASGSDIGTGTDSTVDTETQTTPQLCSEATHVCVEDAVEGWSGPVALYLGDAMATPPACGGDYPSAGLDALTGLEVPASTCACTCGAAENVTCAGSCVLEYHAGTSTCDTATPSYWYLTASCTNLGGEIFGNRYWSFDASGLIVAGGSCQVNHVANVPSVVLHNKLIACGGATDAGGCDDGSRCLPRPAEPFDASLCIFRSGDVLCPSGSAYTERTMYYTSVTDTRACAQCTCSAPAGSCASSSATLMSLPGCAAGSLDLADLPGSGGCVQSSTAANTVAVALNTVATASCTASEGVLGGSAQATNPVTVCCLIP